MVRVGEIENGEKIVAQAEAIWNWASPAGKIRAKRRAQLISDAAELSSGTRALELGCGTGLFTRSFDKSGAEIIAIDVSPALLDRARKKNVSDRVSFHVEDAEALSFEDETFDAVIGSSVLHHLNMDQALREIYRVLKPGGRFAFAEPNMMNPQIAIQGKIPHLRRMLGISPEETAFFRWSLGRQLRRTGFTRVCIQPYDFLHPAVPRPFISVMRGVGYVCERLPIVREIAGSLMISARRTSGPHRL